MTTEAWLFLSLVYLTVYFEYRRHKSSKEYIEQIAFDTFSNMAKDFVMVSIPSLNKNEVRHIFELSEPQEAESN
jgi:hypothetical protein